MSEKTKVHLLILLNHVLSACALYYWGSSPYLWLTLIGWLLFGKIGGEAGFHRYLAHNSFQVGFVLRNILILLGCLNCFGSPLSWLAIHRQHHAAADQSPDPHGCMPAWRVWLTIWGTPRLGARLIIKEMRDPVLLWYHKNYFLTIASIFAVGLVLDLQFFIFLVSMPAVITFHSAGMVNTLCHRWGYRNFQTSDSSYNNLFVNFLTLGSGLHNNHHHFPQKASCSFCWYELDLVGGFIYFFLAKRSTYVERNS